MIYKNFILDKFQEEAINYIKDNRSVLVTAPTGAGKTIIADFVVDRALERNEKVIYTAPIKALSNQKFREFTSQYSPEKVGLVTGDLVINRDAQVLIMTTEILRNMLIEEDPLISQLSYVIFDEIHFLGDLERGTVWEETLIYLPSSVKILGLSATMANIKTFAKWLSYVRNEKVEVVIENERKVPLEIYLISKKTGFLTIEEYNKFYKRIYKTKDNERRFKNKRLKDSITHHYNIIEQIQHHYLPCLYFIFSRRLAEYYAKDLNERVQESFLTKEEQEESLKILEEFKNRNEPELFIHFPMYLKGIAFHHAGLNVMLKWLVERLYERRLIKVLYCTSTFALGMNMPARTVVFDDIWKFDGNDTLPLTVLQFMQKAGRAGRRGMDEKGYVIIKQDFETYSVNSKYIFSYAKGKYEQIESTFNLSYNSVVNLLSRYMMDEIKEIINKSFKNFGQLKVIGPLKREIASLKENLENNLIKCDYSEELKKVRLNKLQDIITKKYNEITSIQNKILYTINLRKMNLLKLGVYNELISNYSEASFTLRKLQDINNNESLNNKRLLRKLSLELQNNYLELDKVKKEFDSLIKQKEIYLCEDCLNFQECQKGDKGKTLKKLNELQKRLTKKERRLFKNFFDKVEVLKRIEYIDEDYNILAGGHILKQIQIEDIFITEMVLEGVFEDVEEALIFGICSSVCYSFPRDILRIKLPSKIKELANRISMIRNSYNVTLAEEYNVSKFIYCPEMIYFGYLWCKGYSINSMALMIQSDTDITGDLVTAFRRARDLIKQLEGVYKDDLYMKSKLNNVLLAISRGDLDVID